MLQIVGDHDSAPDYAGLLKPLIQRGEGMRECKSGYKYNPKSADSHYIIDTILGRIKVSAYIR